MNVIVSDMWGRRQTPNGKAFKWDLKDVGVFHLLESQPMKIGGWKVIRTCSRSSG